jgi:hypothetical protein
MRPVASTDADGTVWWREKHVSADFYTSDQLREAQVEVLMKAVALVDPRAEKTIRRLIDEIERSKT